MTRQLKVKFLDETAIAEPSAAHVPCTESTQTKRCPDFPGSRVLAYSVFHYFKPRMLEHALYNYRNDGQEAIERDTTDGPESLAQG
jgi:hypothetical protein